MLVASIGRGGGGTEKKSGTQAGGKGMMLGGGAIDGSLTQAQGPRSKEGIAAHGGE